MSGGTFLTPEEQVEHCVSKGVQFNAISKRKATAYLASCNNYFKLRSFRKNFVKDATGTTYLNLDFQDLIDLAILDNRLRKILLEMCLSTEHFSKVHLLEVLQGVETDGYACVQDYYNQLRPTHQKRLLADLKKNSSSYYCGNLHNKYLTNSIQNCPVWVFVELISFGQYLHFYEFCAKRTNDKTLLSRLYLLITVKELRNACAHNNCIIHDLRTEIDKRSKPHILVRKALSELGISKFTRNKHLKRAPFFQIVTTLYAHKTMVTSKGVHHKICEQFDDFKGRIYRDRTYDNADIVKSTFNLLVKIIDNWFNVV